MPRKKSIPQETAASQCLDGGASDECPSHDPELDPVFLRRMEQMTAVGLTPSSALELLMHLISQVPHASKDRMEKLKIVDKLLSTARSMMELRLKTEEAEVISLRLDEMEHRLAHMAGMGTGRSATVTEVWNDRPDDL